MLRESKSFPNLIKSNYDILCRFLDAYYKQFTDRTGDTSSVGIGGNGGRTDSDIAVALSTPLFPDAVPSTTLAANGAAGISALGQAIATLNKSDSADVLNSFDPEAILTPGK